MADIKRVYRYEVPIDDGVHMLPAGRVVHVDTRRLRDVEVWIEDSSEDTSDDRRVRVYGTGHDVPEGAVHLGTALSPLVPNGAGTPIERGRFVWHLYAVAELP